MRIRLEVLACWKPDSTNEDLLQEGRPLKRLREGESGNREPPLDISRPPKASRLKEVVQIHKPGTDPPK
ncbi:hypothetical protein QJS04_geneDACA000828 [Acorus gramineus]|uniref:Uncharacterized protein n=1 Tax=Acorus gramineus TaxID=55184 RepID=A0AAV9BIG5_ACOGR|nr:hypothetical protein QJS04_geneDACA000828 [Acorus gramineus]